MQPRTSRVPVLAFAVSSFAVGAVLSAAAHFLFSGVVETAGDFALWTVLAGGMGTAGALRSTLQSRRFYDRSRLVDAYAAADRRSAGVRSDGLLRETLANASIPGAYDDPETGSLRYVYSAWRSGLTPTQFEPLVPQSKLR